MPDGLDIPFINLGQGTGDPKSAAPAELFVNQDEDSAIRAHRVRRTVEGSMGMVRTWQAVAREAQRFYDGHQWEDYDRMMMEQSKRPVLTFNEIKKYVRSVCGLERLNRTDVRFTTRPLDSSVLEDAMGDLATEAVSAIDDLSEAHYERSLVVKDVVIKGMGFLELRVSFDEDLEGQILKERVDPMEMRWDTHSRRSGLVDSRWRARVRNMPREEFKKRWPGKADLVDAAAPDVGEWGIQKYEMVTPYYSVANQQANPQVGEINATKSTIPVIQFQEKFEVPVYRIADPNSPNDLLELSQSSYKQLIKEFKEEGLPPPDAVRQTKTLYRQMYVAHGIELEEPVVLPGNYFSLLCMTGEWDEEKKVWVGIVPDMIDPQKTKNKALSTALHFYLTNAKGGVMFETGAFVNETRAKDEWSSPNPWIALNEGGLKKVEQRKPTEMPSSLQAFFQIGTQGIGDVAGLSQELLGVGQSEMSNPTQRSRLAGSLAILGWFFDEINRFRKEESRTTLEFVKEFATDGRLITIGGAFNSKAIPLLKSNLPIKYMLEVDESVKYNPNLKDRVWADLMPIVPALLRFGAGQVLLSLLKFSPLPAQVVHEIQRSVAMNPPQGPQGRGKQEPPEIVAAKAKKLGAEGERALAQARSLDQQGPLKIAELVLEGVKLSSDTKGKRDLREHRSKVDTLKVLQSLIPGIK